jgi:hypothetical protein
VLLCAGSERGYHRLRVHERAVVAGAGPDPEPPACEAREDFVMTEHEAEWEYRVTTVDDKHPLVNEDMKKWAEAGWELVSGSAVPFVSTGSGGGIAPLWHARYVMYWRKRVVPAG